MEAPPPILSTPNCNCQNHNHLRSLEEKLAKANTTYLNLQILEEDHEKLIAQTLQQEQDFKKSLDAKDDLIREQQYDIAAAQCALTDALAAHDTIKSQLSQITMRVERSALLEREDAPLLAALKMQLEFEKNAAADARIEHDKRVYELQQELAQAQKSLAHFVESENALLERWLDMLDLEKSS
jgi:chromosome segregation ATPase